ncbi:hypothetical protein EV363DRAFT_1310647 [Boletus edulis]|uniref:Histone deacetylase complex subunit SAP30 Sin3 binding domain-containing protein n=1 Tax=Boletus edulis BED1 TaxID=1328754 RepID=A0AAD4GJX2_BOLED|nr:hypothetical protein EV363DRAFT_1310647 [Boletus edulis]KAF8446430.1 hypothetical protein L210DRAFT_3530045 [Boletus edulis BED1]
MSANGILGAVASGSRSRPQARKKPNDDAAYFGPPTASKRQAVDRAEGEPRVKRKRVEPLRKVGRTGVSADADEEKSSIDFKSLPVATLHRYISHFNLIPIINPSPLSLADPPTPAFLLEPTLHSSRALSPLVIPTPANRPRRDPKDQSRRRSSRLLEDNETRTPIMSDVAEVHTLLAVLAERHFQDYVVNEIDTLASFMVKTKCESCTS